MSGAELAGLVGLALIDSTSIGTLLLPLVLLVAPRVHVGRYLVYLGTVAGFCALVGLGLVAGADWLLDAGADVGEVRALRWVELVVGGLLLSLGAVVGVRRRFARRPATSPGQAERAERQQARLVGPDASYGAVAGVGLVAALVEVGSMLPFLAALGIIIAADQTRVGSMAVVIGYTVVMMLPALGLLGLRLAWGNRLERPLGRASTWLTGQAGRAGPWVLAIIAILLLQDAWEALRP